MAFNSQGACRKCDGTGIVSTVDELTLVPDESLSIDEGAVLPWQTLIKYTLPHCAMAHV